MTAKYDRNVNLPWRRAAFWVTAQGFFGAYHFVKHRMTITGSENIPKEQCLFVANHLSNDDPGLLALASKKLVTFIAKQELYDMKIFGPLVRFYGAISINRTSPEASTFKFAKEAFKKGWSIGMFIEGTRSKTPGILGQPHEGAAYFAKVLKAPIVPVGIIGTNIAWGKAYTRIGMPIQPSDDVEKTTWEIMESLSKLTGYALPPHTVRSSKPN